MARKYIVFGVFTTAMIVVIAFIVPVHKAPQSNGELSLIVEPDDGMAPVLDAINSAHRSVDLTMYELDDRQVEDALIADVTRGVAVRVILSAGYNGAASTVNTAAFEELRAAHVPVQWSPSYFSLTHEKSLVVDGERAIIMTFNLVAKYYPTGRDFGVVDHDAGDVSAMERTFDADWRGEGFYRGGNGVAAGDDLLWSPGSEAALMNLIGSAERSLFIYNEEMADPKIVKVLMDAAGRGVEVDVVMTGADEWRWEFAELTTAGARVRTYADDDNAPLYIHAKMIIADGARAFVGSENFSEASLQENRELGIMTANSAVIAGLTKTFAGDWHEAKPFIGVQ